MEAEVSSRPKNLQATEQPEACQTIAVRKRALTSEGRYSSGRDEQLTFYEPTLHLDETVRNPRWMG